MTTRKISVAFILTIICVQTFGQIPVIEEPKTPTFPNFRTNPFNPSAQPTKPRKNPLEQYEKDKRELSRTNPELYNSLYNSQSLNVSYDLPSFSNIAGTEQFRKVAQQLENALNGQTELSLKEAVFNIENAYFENKLNYNQFDNQIKELIEIARLATIQNGYDWNNPQTRNIMLFRAMSDTLKINSLVEERFVTSYPMKYDYEDFAGHKDWSKMFVSKLLASKTGQCHSLPLLYLILCEETNTKAFLANSPSHTYIKFQDNNQNWHNLELTCGRTVSDAFILGSGYITSEALKNEIYMQPLTKQETFAQCLADLAKGYTRKYGFDNFVSECIDTTLKYAPQNMYARMIKSDYQTVRFEYVVNQVGRPHPDVLKTRYPKVYNLLEERNKTYQFIDNSGYQDMPEKAYADWLNSVQKEQEKQKQESNW